METLQEALPELLRAFALRLGYRPPSRLYLNLKIFFYTNERKIVNYFRNASRQYERQEYIPAHSSTSPSTRSTGEASGRRRRASEPLYEVFSESEDRDDDWHRSVRDSTLPPPAFAKRTAAYRWLLSSIKAHIVLKHPQEGRIMFREEAISRWQARHDIRQADPTEECFVLFSMAWAPRKFLLEQEYSESPGDAIQGAITLSGSTNNAQALQCGLYLQQTWPEAGEQMMKLVVGLVESPSDALYANELCDGTSVKITEVGPDKINIGVRGPIDSIAEVGEQLAWLGCALRSAPEVEGVSTCNALFEMEDNNSREMTFAYDYHCAIRFQVHTPKLENEDTNGQCWHQMFRKPVIATGFPVASRGILNAGLEIPLNVMSGLAQARYVNEWDGSLMIKGYSVTLVMVQCWKNFLFWHYSYSQQGKRLSYSDLKVDSLHEVAASELGAYRHIVGWCRDSRYYAGSDQANCTTERSGLPSPRAGFLLEKVSLGIGKGITGGASFAVGVKDMPLHLPRNSYISKLNWISQKYFVFWDEDDKRGWLVNGTSALLHVVMASLEYDSQGDFSSSSLFRKEDMVCSGELYKPNTASQVLAHPKNLGLKKTSYYRFKDRVEQCYNTIEQMIDRQQKVAGRDGIKLRFRARKHLEGWDLKDIATDRDPRPRVATLHAYGYGWVDFIRAIGAVALLGRGFGDLIRPTDPRDQCEATRTVPRNKYYLATAISDLMRIREMFGDRTSRPVKICRGLVWHCDENTFSPCPCQTRLARQRSKGKILFNLHRDPVQVILPSHSKLILPSTGCFDLEEHRDGAVIWGHRLNFGYRWADQGELEMGEPRPPPQPPKDEFVDSGLGSSLGSMLVYKEVHGSPEKSPA
ncbi:hypothetical protein BJ166DRAFT_604946, partial [Pestalotiopsis sp. NC0098]